MLLYPMFSKVELLGIRLGGPGLGNLLFIWAHSLVYAKKKLLGYDLANLALSKTWAMGSA